MKYFSRMKERIMFQYQFTSKYGGKSIGHLTWKHHSSCIPMKWEKRNLKNTKCGTIKLLSLYLHTYITRNSLRWGKWHSKLAKCILLLSIFSCMEHWLLKFTKIMCLCTNHLSSSTMHPNKPFSFCKSV